MHSLVTLRTITLPPAADDDRRALDQRLRETLELPGLAIPLPVLKNAHRTVKTKQRLSCVIARTGESSRLVDVDRSRSYSLAMDIGTTNLVAALYDNAAQQDLLTRTVENPQILFGSDILTRLQHAMTGDADELHRVLLTGVNDLIGLLCSDAAINTEDIHGMAVAGNTVMTHFFLGLDATTIPVAPFTPIVRVPGFFTAAELGLALHPEAAVFVFPNAGSYVGGDITAGILATGMHRSDHIELLVDVGTNAEVVIGNRDWMIVGAGAAGPALEEGIVRAGRRATSGIIYDVEIRDGATACRTFDDAPPRGICGSGMVSLLFEMRQAGIVDQTGALRDHGSVEQLDGEKAFLLACGNGERIPVSQTEIRNFLRSKAAMFTLLLTLTRSVGVTFRDIETVFVSGALGTGIDLRKAAGIGMVPSWPAEIVRPLGNTSLAGCRLLLRDAGRAGETERLVGRITYKHMHDDPEFMKEFMGAVFLPHTNPDLLKTT